MTLGEAIALRTRQLLDDKDMTQYKLAKLMAIQQPTLSKYMNARHKSANLKTVFQICKGLDISIVEFFNCPLFINNDKLDID